MNWDLILQYLQTILSSWPLAILIVAILFRKQLPKLVTRLEQLKGGGLEARFREEQQPPDTKPAGLDDARVEQAVSEFNRWLQHHLAEIESSATVSLGEDEVRNIAKQLRELDDERKYWMFEYLDEFLTHESKMFVGWAGGIGGPPIPMKHVRSFFEDALWTVKDPRSILDVLIFHRLLQESEDKKTLRITPLGMEFRRHLQEKERAQGD